MPEVKKTSKTPLATEDFTNHPEVLECLKQLRSTFSATARPFVVSDVLDADGNQYVNLVQKGGGVLGVALVGYKKLLQKLIKKN